MTHPLAALAVPLRIKEHEEAFLEIAKTAARAIEDAVRVAKGG